jgi:Domain of unknown function (DUF3825)
MKVYSSLFKTRREQDPETAFAHFYPIDDDYDEPFKIVARQSMDGIDAWHFHQDRFKNKHPNTSVPKLKNYLNYTFKRLLDLESAFPGQFFIVSKDEEWITFNTGLNNIQWLRLAGDIPALQMSGWNARPARLGFQGLLRAE